MPKNIVQDVVAPPTKRSVRNIPISKTRVSDEEVMTQRVPLRTRPDVRQQVSDENPEIHYTADQNFQEQEEDKSPLAQSASELITPTNIRGPQPVTELQYPRSQTSRTPVQPSALRFDNMDDQSSVHIAPRFPHWVIWLIGIACASIAFFAFGSVFEQAKVTITHKAQKVIINLNLVAKSTGEASDLLYTPLTLSSIKSESVSADGTKHVEQSATGSIIIYNNYSSANQRLVKNTRFETPDGLIYKIRDSIVIPGKRTDNGKTIPGSIEAPVFAESAGDEYNIGLTDFTIPGFKSNPARYSSFYARSKTPMRGGKIGTIKSISDSKLAEAKARLQGALTKEMIASARAKISDDSILYDSAYRIEFEDVPANDTTGDTVTVSVKGKFVGFTLNRTALNAQIAESSLPNFDHGAIAIPDEDTLQFDIKNKEELSTGSVGPVRFNLHGMGTIVWQFDQSKFRDDLKGKAKEDLNTIASKYPGIAKAEVTLRPFWRSTFPTNASKIIMNVVDPIAPAKQ